MKTKEKKLDHVHHRYQRVNLQRKNGKLKRKASGSELNLTA